VRLSPLYQELLIELYTSGFMRSDQIEAMLRVIAAREEFPLPQKSLRRMVQKKLKELVEAGLLKRIVPPVVPDTRTGPPFLIYTLTKSGALLVANSLGMTLGELGWRPADDVTFLFLGHILALVEYKLALAQACLAKGIRLSEWVGDKSLRRDPAKITLTSDAGEQTQVSIVPDAYYLLELEGGLSLSCCLEIDRGTSTVETSKWQAKSWRRKVMAYQALQQQENSTNDWSAPGFAVTTVTTSPTRMAHLQSICEDAGGGNHFWFTTFDQVSASTILAELIWQVAGKGNMLHRLVPEHSHDASAAEAAGSIVKR
jgi:hypothetical protein